MIRGILFVFVFFMNFSCVTRSSDGPTIHTVMVIDSGFDTSLEVFQGKIEATYSLECGPISCDVREGFEPDFEKDPELLSSKEKWNEAIKSRDFSKLSIEEIQNVQSRVKLSHGTATASIIAYKNPNVRLILVKKTMTDQVREVCFTDENRKKYKYYTDVVKDNWDLDSKREHPEEREIFKLATKHRVDFINKSYGNFGPDKYTREMIGMRWGCPELAELMIAVSHLEAEQINNMGVYKNSPHLTFQSAGNESSKVDSMNDTPECTVKGDNHLYVGAFDAYNKVSQFSNYGACVDFYVLGTRVVSASPGGLLFPVDGTSFSSPLAVRLITESFPSQDPKDIKNYIINNMDSRRFLKINKAHLEKIAYDFGAGKTAFGLAGKHEPVFADFTKKFAEEELASKVNETLVFTQSLKVKK